MKTTDWALLALGGVALYFLFKPGYAAASSDTASPDIRTPATQATIQILPTDTPKQAVDKINTYVESGNALPRTSATLLKGVTATLKSTGETYKGNIATLTTDLSGTQKTLFIAAKASPRDASGSTSIDKVIAQAKAAGLKKPLNANY